MQDVHWTVGSIRLQSLALPSKMSKARPIRLLFAFHSAFGSDAGEAGTLSPRTLGRSTARKNHSYENAPTRFKSSRAGTADIGLVGVFDAVDASHGDQAGKSAEQLCRKVYALCMGLTF